jgi:ribosomal protein S18 acetylase RimI-like enzyme
LTNSMDHGLIMYGYSDNNKIIGCVGIQDSKKDNIFYIERLGVLPEHRHKNIGKKLLDFAFETIKNNNGEIASIGIMNENELLKNWYEKYGFRETGIKKFDHLPFTVCFMQKPIK